MHATVRRLATFGLTLAFATTTLVGVGAWCCPDKEVDTHACCRTKVAEHDLVSRTPCCPPSELQAPEGHDALARAETPVGPEAPSIVAALTPRPLLLGAAFVSAPLEGTRGVDTGPPPPRAWLQVWLS